MTDEKNFDEKDEKEVLKHDEKVEENDRLSSIAWAFILMWAGLVFLAQNMGWFDRMGMDVGLMWSFGAIGDWRSFGVWNLIALGAGVILVLETIARLLIPEFRRHVGGSLVVAAVFIGVGLGGWFDWAYLWPLILIAVGVNILLKGLRRRGGGGGE
jgi:hypothetical protein